MNTVTILGRLVPAAALMLIAGCNSNSAPSAENGAAPAANAAPAATEEPQKSYTGAAVTPPKGLGNAQGKVLWDGKPAVGINVRLCETIGFIGGCSGKTFSTKTDKDGNYTVDKVPPGEYSLAVQIFDTNSFLYPTSGILSAAKFPIKADQTLDIRATNLYKLDLQVASPRAGEVIKTGKPKLAWKAYAGAVNYEVTVSPESGTGNSQTFKTAAATASPDTALLNGSYKWKVTALNASDVKIAETASDTPFKVTGQAGSAIVTLVEPKSGSTVSSKGLIFKWSKHPLADGYRIYLSKSGATDSILSFEPVRDTTYKLDKPLEPADYYWSVSATKGGEKMAESKLEPFTVK